ncbi:uncharacterized protein LOC135146602 isoform X1 [Zophobas morio]|uniref:uncharacterized protein LOC135146602 isoform X1 n=1 Tax=Zophobas morio TaxID=2755281 RepID=UPI0030828193
MLGERLPPTRKISSLLTSFDIELQVQRLRFQVWSDSQRSTGASLCTFDFYQKLSLHRLTTPVLKKDRATKEEPPKEKSILKRKDTSPTVKQKEAVKKVSLSTMGKAYGFTKRLSQHFQSLITSASESTAESNEFKTSSAKLDQAAIATQLKPKHKKKAITIKTAKSFLGTLKKNLKNEGDANQEDPHEQDGSVQSADDPYEFEYETAAQQGRTESDALIDYEEGYNFGGAKLPEEEYESKDCKKPSLPEDPPLKNPNIWRVQCANVKLCKVELRLLTGIKENSRPILKDASGFSQAISCGAIEYFRQTNDPLDYLHRITVDSLRGTWTLTHFEFVLSSINTLRSALQLRKDMSSDFLSSCGQDYIQDLISYQRESRHLFY